MNAIRAFFPKMRALFSNIRKRAREASFLPLPLPLTRLITTFVIVECRQMKELKNLRHLEFLTQQEHKIQNQLWKAVLQK